MHNWRLLLLAFVAVCYPAASYTESNLVDGREPCCDRPPHTLYQETRFSYGTHRFGKPAPENLLNHRGEIREDRRYEVRTDNSLLIRPSADRRHVENRSERDARQFFPEHTYRFTRAGVLRVRATEDQRITPISKRSESHRISSRDISGNERSREIARIRITRESDVRQHDRQNRELLYNRMSRDNRRVVRRFNEERRSTISMDSRREIQRSRDNAGELRNIHEAREARYILQRTRDDVARSQIYRDRSGRRILNGKVVERDAFTALSESLYLDNKRERRTLNNNDHSRVARELADERRTFTARSESRLHLDDNNKERRTLDRNTARISREGIARSESRHLLDNNRERRYLERSDNRRIAREIVDERRVFNDRSESMLHLDEHNRESRSLDRDVAQISSERMDERRAFIARSESRHLINKNRERRSLERSDNRRIAREIVDERRAFNVRSESRLHHDERNRERLSLDRDIARMSSKRIDERHAFNKRSESRLQLDRERTSLDRNDGRKSRERMDERHAFITRAESRHLFDNRERGSLERTDDMNIARERAYERRVFTTHPEINNNRELRTLNRRLSDSVNEYRRSSLPDMRTVDHNRNRREESRASIRSERHESQRFNTGREVDGSLVERRQKRERTADMSRESQDERNKDTRRSIRLERPVNLRDNRFGEMQSRVREERAASKSRRVESRQDRPSIRHRDVVTERRTRSVDQLEFRDARRDTKPVRSIDVHRERETSAIQVEYRIAKNYVERNSRYRSGEELNRVHYKDKTQANAMNWQYLFYTLQGIYICGILIQMLSENESDKKTSRAPRWWTSFSRTLVKVD